MSLQQTVDQIYRTLFEQSQDGQAILLHPDSYYRSVIVAKLVSAADRKVFYYALGPDDIELPAFLYGLIHDMADQHPTFGRHLNMLSQSTYANADAHFNTILETFLEDFRELSSEPFIFVLDEYDRSDTADDVQRFIHKLISNLPQHCRLVINSRTLPRLSWLSLIAQKRAIILKDAELVTDNFYGRQIKPETDVEVFALGPGFVLLNGEPIDAWEGHLPRLLLFFALDRPVVTRSEICKAFWPDLDSDQAVNVFHVTKRRLHKALNIDVLVHEDGYYSVNPDLTVYYDVSEFVNLLIAGRDETNPDRIEAWQNVVDLYRGPFLQGHLDEWIVDRRKDFQTGYLEALTHMAQVWLERDRREKALALFQRAIDEDYSQESLHREIMRLYAEMGRRSEAAAHFQQLEARLRALGTAPESETVAIYKRIMG